MRKLFGLAAVAVIASGVVLIGCGGDDSGPPVGGAGADASTDSTTVGDGGGVTDTKKDSADADAAGPSPGATCTSDADCGGGGLKCVLPSDNLISGGGTVHGYCTMQCNDYLNDTVNDDPCDPLGATCTDFGTNTAHDGWCMQKCTVDPTQSAFSKKKCRGRKDVGCFSLTSSPSDGVCFPICAKDSDCGDGRKCDFTNPVFAVCKDAASAKTGKPLGSSCTQASDCQGACFTFTRANVPDGASDTGTTAHICSNACVIGSTDSCNYVQGAVDAGAGMGYCLYGNAGAGDRGICGALCDIDSDCANQDQSPQCNPGTIGTTGHGYCVANYPGTYPPPEGGTDAGDASTDVTTDQAATDSATDTGAVDSSGDSTTVTDANADSAG